MRLNWIDLKNFRGIPHLKFEPDGKNTNVFAKNQRGKTSIARANAWLLTDRDLDASQAYVKTIDTKTSQEAHALSHEVTGQYVLDDGEVLTLKKVLAEKHVKKRGSAKKTITGNQVDHFINDAPVTATAYKKRLAEIAEPELMQILINPLYFGKLMPDKAKSPAWQRRQEYIFQFCGDIPVKEVISTSKKLAKLPDILGKLSIEAKKTQIDAEKTKLNKMLDRFEARLEENEKGLPDLDGLDKNELQKAHDDLKADIDKLTARRAATIGGGELAEARRQDNELLNKLNTMWRAATEELEDKARVVEKTLNELESANNKLSNEAANLLSKSNNATEQAETLQKQIHELHQEWYDLEKQVVEIECPKCGEKISPNKEYLHKRQATITEQGKKVKERMLALRKEAEKLKRGASEISDKRDVEGVNTATAELAALRAEITAKDQYFGYLVNYAPYPGQDGIPENDKGLKLSQQRKELRTKIENLESDNDTEVAKVDLEIDAANETLKTYSDKLALFDKAKGVEDRQAEIEEEESATVKRFEELESQLLLIEEFVRKKAKMMGAKIGKILPKGIGVKFFEEQYSGGLKQTCELTLDGKPFSELSGGEQIFCGCAWIKALSHYHKTYLPLFLDEAREVTMPLDLPEQTQVVKLYASEIDDTLRVEHE